METKIIYLSERRSEMKLEILKKSPDGDPKNIIIFVHGAGCGAWCWHKYLKYFSEKGYECIAVSLRGHGKSEGHENLNQYGLSDYVQDVNSVVMSLEEKPILVGHSMGGAIVQRYIAEYQDKVKAAVLFASAPCGGTTIKVIWRLLQQSFIGSINAMKVLLGRKLPTEKIAEAVFFDGRVPINQVRQYKRYLQAESIQAQIDLQKPYTSNYKVNIPVYIIGSRGDKVFPEKEQMKTAKAYGVQPVMLDKVCHDMMLDPEWEKPAKLVLQFIESVE